MWLKKYPRLYRNIRLFLRLRFGLLGFLIVFIIPLVTIGVYKIVKA